MGGNWEKTAELYEKIANRGHPTAQVHLGKQYVHGNGVEMSLIKAYKWFFCQIPQLANTLSKS